MKNSDYLIHYGVQGMRWGFRKRIPRSSGSSRSNKPEKFQEIDRKKAYNRAKKKVRKLSKSAAKAYYKKDRTKDFQNYQKYDRLQNKKEARLTRDQIADGRYRVANTRAITRSALSTSIGMATTVSLAALGAGAVAPILGVSLSALTNGVTGGNYYMRKSLLYGNQRMKLQKALAK